MDKLLTVADAAQRLQISPLTLYRMIGRGELPCRRIGRAVRVRESDLERYIKGGENAVGEKEVKSDG